MPDPIVALLFCAAATAHPDYTRLHVFELAAMAQRVVAGEITAVQEETFDLTVERDLLGNAGATTLRLKRFQDWMCAGRWDEYRAGQRICLFLYGDETLGAGNEGDWPMVEQRALVPFKIRGVEYERLPSIEEVSGSPVPLDELEAALRGYRRVFAVGMEPTERGRERLTVSLALDESAAEAFARTSAIARQLVDETLSSPAFLASRPLPVTPLLEGEPLVRSRNGVLGEQMASPGDIDGDGWDDLAVLDDQRKVRIGLMDAAGVRTSVLVEPDSAAATDLWFAAGLAPVGDVDRDGVPDLAVGAPARDHSGRGRVGLLLLARDGNVKETRWLEGAALADTTAGFGSSVSAIGDLDGNGAVDLAVDVDWGFEFSFGSFVSQAKEEPRLRGLELLLLESPAAVLRRHSIDAREFLTGRHDVTFGDALTTVGDLDGDGLSEIAFGFAFDDDGGEERGAVWIAFLARDGSVRAKRKISDWSDDFPALLLDYDQLGLTLAAPGDLDADGVPDLVVGGARELWVLSLGRDGSVRRFRTCGARAGGFLAVDRILSLAVLRGPDGSRRLAVGARGEDDSAGIWLFGLGPDGILSAR